MKKSLLILALLGMAIFSQAQVTKTVSVIPGGLYKALTFPERSSITHLTLTGSLDARDFKTMRDAMPALKVVDLTKVSIVAYEGTEGTEESDKGKFEKHEYAANTIPQYSFYKKKNGSGKRTIEQLIYPKNLAGVGEKAFYACYHLSEVTLPTSVNKIETEAYSNCKSLNSVTVLGDGPIASMGKGVFFAVDLSSCVLHIKKDTKSTFQDAKQWNEFQNIEEDAPSTEAVEEAPAAE